MLLAQASDFVGPEVQWYSLAPLLSLVGGGLVLMLLAALFPGRWPRGGYALFTAVVAGVAGVPAGGCWAEATVGIRAPTASADSSANAGRRAKKEGES